jgi:phenylalanyl-tRNA synthetase beta chain
MKFTLSWLKDHLDTSASLEALTAKLSAVGLEVESVDDAGARLAPFTVARVIAAKPHPNADRLSVCTLDTGAGVVEVVCGAANAKTGMIGVFAPVGSRIPGTDAVLERRTVRGVTSNGMLLSERELGLSENHAGVIELGLELAHAVGRGYAEVMGLADPVIEVKLTPNRPDCTGVRGIARDLAAAGLGTLREDKLPSVEGGFDCPIDIELDFPADARTACPCFAGRYIAGVENGDAPAWMQQRLRAVGRRAINSRVDVTNKN